MSPVRLPSIESLSIHIPHPPQLIFESEDDHDDEPQQSPSPKSTPTTPATIQFFVRMISLGNSVVITAKSDDTIAFLHARIYAMTGIPIEEQRMIYRGRLLELQKTLADCAVENDAGLQLVGRMRSTKRPLVCRLINEIVTTAMRLYKGEEIQPKSKSLPLLMSEFIALIVKKDSEELAIGNLQMFSSFCAPVAFVMLYLSPEISRSQCALNCINQVLAACKFMLPEQLRTQFAILVLEFCTLLGRDSNDAPLYVKCRNTLGLLLAGIEISNGEDGKTSVSVYDIFPFVSELSDQLSQDLDSGVDFEQPSGNVRDLALFMIPLRNAIIEELRYAGLYRFPLTEEGYDFPFYKDEMAHLYTIFTNLLEKMDECLDEVESFSLNEDNIIPEEWSQYLKILKLSYGISRLYEGAGEKFRTVLRKRRTLISKLVENCGTTNDDHRLVFVLGDDNGVPQFTEEDFEDEEPSMEEEEEFYGQFEEESYADEVFDSEIFADEVCDEELFANQVFEAENFADEICEEIFADQVCKVEIFADEVCEEEIFADQLCKAENYADEVCDEEIFAGDVCEAENFADEVYDWEIFADELYQANFFASKVSDEEIFADEVCEVENFADEVRDSENFADEVREAENFADQVCEAESFADEVCDSEKFADQVCMAENFADQVCEAEIFAREVCEEEIFEDDVCEVEILADKVCEAENFARKVCE